MPIERIVTTQILGDAYPPRQWKEGDRRFLTHSAVIIDDTIERALCGQVQPESLSDDTFHQTADDPTCKRCLARLKRLKRS